jgi:glutathione synthase/RimK-type ligase-like ATP-grasp enzyme
MLKGIKDNKIAKRIRKSTTYAMIRQLFPMADSYYTDDRENLEEENPEIVLLDWPKNIEKPTVGIVKDYGDYPRWTKYCRFMENNLFNYDFYNIHAHDWVEMANHYDVFIGIPSSDYPILQEIRTKYYFLETHLGKICYPSAYHTIFYENKRLEAYLSNAFDLPFANTYISHNKEDALSLLEKLPYPIVSKIDPGSGSFGVGLVQDQQHARKIIEQAFSRWGRSTHWPYLRQKNYIYFQEYIPNDGYDIRVIVVGNKFFGYFRKVLEGDFRASGMDQVEKRHLPEDAMRIAMQVNELIKSPQLVVDMLHGIDDAFYIIEISPFCQMETPAQLKIGDEPSVYIYENGTFHLENKAYWVHELAIKEFLLKDYLPRVQ